MMNQIKMISDDTKLPEWMSKFGDRSNQNALPLGWKEVTLQEYAARHGTYMPEFIEFRQMMVDQDGKDLGYLISGNLEYYSDGVGLMAEYRYAPSAENQFVYEYQAYYYMFGCDHEWGGEMTEQEKSRRLFRTEHAYKCKKCGYFQVIDSSD